jgi:hypothetical protein
MMSDQFVNQSEFARLEGCDEKQVRRGLARGALVAREVDGLLDRAQVGCGWRRPRADSKAPPRASDIRSDIANARSNVRSDVRPRGLVRLRRREAAQRLAALDWTQTFDWSETAVHERVAAAAAAVRLQAVRSDLRDDGHWGGYQVRNIELIERHGRLCLDAILAGFGFDLDEADALAECRSHLHREDDTEFDMADLVEVRLDLLPLLAYPFFPEHRPPADDPAAHEPPGGTR